MQYDLANRKQLPDLADFGKVKGPPMVLIMCQMPDGRLVIATGRTIVLLDQNSGEILREIKMESSGWAAMSPGVEEGQLLVGNFFTGEFIMLRLEDEKILARGSIGEKNSLSGIAQFVGK